MALFKFGVVKFISLSLTQHDFSLHKTLNTSINNFSMGTFTLHFGFKYEIIYQLDAIEYLFVFFQLDIFRAYTPIFRSNGCYNFFTYAAYGVL